MTTDLQTYTQQLLLALRMREVPGPRIAEALAEVQSHVEETGEDPADAFGSPTSYADQLVAALAGDPSGPDGWWSGTMAVGLVFGLGSFAGAWLVLDAALDLATGKSGLMGLSPVAWLVIGALVLGGLAVRLFLMGRDASVPVLDPRTGADMVPAAPRWLLPVMVMAPLLGLVLALAVGLASR